MNKNNTREPYLNMLERLRKEKNNSNFKGKPNHM